MNIFRVILLYNTDDIDLPGIGINGFFIDIFASTGEEAVVIAEREHPDMVISEVVCRTC